VDCIKPTALFFIIKVKNQPDAQYSVFWRKVKYIMLCMVLWRYREYPVDKSVACTENGSSKGFWLIDFSCLKIRPIKKYYRVKLCIKNLYRALEARPNQGCRDEI
jgi:hypothetical protein